MSMWNKYLGPLALDGADCEHVQFKIQSTHKTMSFRKIKMNRIHKTFPYSCLLARMPQLLMSRNNSTYRDQMRLPLTIPKAT